MCNLPFTNVCMSPLLVMFELYSFVVFMLLPKWKSLSSHVVFNRIAAWSCLGWLKRDWIDKMIRFHLNVPHSVHLSCPRRQDLQFLAVAMLCSKSPAFPPQTTNSRLKTERVWKDLPWEENKRMRGYLVQEKEGCSRNCILSWSHISWQNYSLWYSRNIVLKNQKSITDISYII